MRELIRAGHSVAESARISADPPQGSDVRGDGSGSRATHRRGGGRVLAVGQSDVQVRALAADVLALDQPAVCAAISERLRRHGVVTTWDQLLLPVFKHIGHRYERFGDCIEAEHLYSECVRAVLDTVWLKRPARAEEPPVLLCALDGEQHVLALHVLAAALAELGAPSRLLGACTPPDALRAAAARLRPRAVFLWSQQEPTAEIATLRHLPPRRPSTPVVLGGPGWRHVDLPTHAMRVDSLSAAIQAVTDVVAYRRDEG